MVEETDDSHLAMDAGGGCDAVEDADGGRRSVARPKTAVAGRRTRCRPTAAPERQPDGKASSSAGSSSSFPDPDLKARHEEEAMRAVPSDVPSIVEIKRVLPPHCFKPTVARSMYYVFKDLAIVAALYGTYLLVERSEPVVCKYLLMPVYWFLQGTMFWALFVLGHDCGHGSFSHSSLLNDAVGNLLHAAILVPYYPWKVSHRHHHKNTGNIDRDEIFYPVRESANERTPGKPRFLPLFGFGTSWFYYLYKGYAPRAANHLNPRDPLFARDAVQCAVSLGCCGAWVALALLPYAGAFGWTRLAVHYGAPVFVFASWLVVTTFLHHQDENVPWYADEKWDFVKGNLSSVDRDYGWAHTLTHNIGTHQIHHLFSKIPHYYLEDATAAFRSRFPHLVRVSRQPILAAFRKMFYIFDQQQWVHDDTQFHVYRAGRKGNY